MIETLPQSETPATEEPMETSESPAPPVENGENKENQDTPQASAEPAKTEDINMGEEKQTENTEKVGTTNSWLLSNILCLLMFLLEYSIAMSCFNSNLTDFAFKSKSEFVNIKCRLSSGVAFFSRLTFTIAFNSVLIEVIKRAKENLFQAAQVTLFFCHPVDQKQNKFFIVDLNSTHNTLNC